MAGRLIISVVCLLLFDGKALAGWYHVENYQGMLGPTPVHLSIQTYDGFGSGVTIHGSYYEDAARRPVALYGKADGSRLTVCAIADEGEFQRILVIGSKKPFDLSRCPISLTLDAGGATGEWIKGSTRYPFKLKKVAALDDTGEGVLDGKVEIPFWAQTATHMFSGVYAKTDAGICMLKLLIIGKDSGKPTQEITFPGDTELCNAGALMTSIYENVEREDGDGIYVNFRGGGAGTTISYAFDRKSGKYKQLP